jgi:DNA-binding transcriptional MerR regulator
MIRRFRTNLRLLGNRFPARAPAGTVDSAENQLTMDTMSAAAADSPGGEKTLFRIGEVCRLTSLKPFVLRYWETEFPMLQPLKSSSGHRLYRREDIETVFEIKRLLYQEGFTIAGARRFLEQRGENGGQATAPLEEEPRPASHAGAEAAGAPGARAAAVGPPASQSPGTRAGVGPRRLLLDLHEQLRAILTLLEGE